MKWLTDFMGQPVFALLGAVGMFGLASGFLTIDQGIQDWLNAWLHITRPVWDFLLGGVFDWFGWTLPNLLKDYLTLGVISASMRHRARRVIMRNDATIVHKFWYRYSDEAKDAVRKFHRPKSLLNHAWTWINNILFWPLQTVTDFAIYRFIILPRFKYLEPIDKVAAEAKEINMASSRDYWQTYFATLVWFAILLAINYALLFDWFA